MLSLIVITSNECVLSLFLGCPGKCFQHCLIRYGGNLFQGNTLFCQRGCAQLKGRKIVDSNKFCLDQDFEKCKAYCHNDAIFEEELSKCNAHCAHIKRLDYYDYYGDEIESCEADCQTLANSSDNENQKRCEYGCTFWNVKSSGSKSSGNFLA